MGSLYLPIGLLHHLIYYRSPVFLLLIAIHSDSFARSSFLVLDSATPLLIRLSPVVAHSHVIVVVFGWGFWDSAAATAAAAILLEFLGAFALLGGWGSWGTLSTLATWLCHNIAS